MSKKCAGKLFASKLKEIYGQDSAMLMDTIFPAHRTSSFS